MNNQIGHWRLAEIDNKRWHITQNGTDLFVFFPRPGDVFNDKHYKKSLAALVKQANTADSKSDACTRAYVKALERKIRRQSFDIKQCRKELAEKPKPAWWLWKNK